MSALATPASADNEQYRLEVPATAKAGTTLTGIRGSCAGDGNPHLLSDAFVGGEAKVHGQGRFTATAEIVDQTGEFWVYLTCAGHKVDIDIVTVF